MLRRRLRLLHNITTLVCTVLWAATAEAAPHAAFVSGSFDSANGTLAFLAGDAFSAEIVFDTDTAAASVEQHDDPSPEPDLDKFDAWGFTGAPYKVKVMTSEIPGGVETLPDCEVKVYDNDSSISNATLASFGITPPDPGTDPNVFDIIEYLGVNTTELAPDPDSPLMGTSADGIEVGLNAVLLGDWLETNNPSTLDLPPSGDVYTYLLIATEYDGSGNEVGMAYAVLPAAGVTSGPPTVEAVPAASPSLLPVFAAALLLFAGRRLSGPAVVRRRIPRRRR
ncbi:MAG: hypothetical protein JRG80_19995 [Deltaproteobacteria bacterium]|nr:hypothetical protein [Deltaproteobacteria bacterium]MBW2401506.1 hypothetical protein [Deltaproteobacteria bacterium]MBW2665404.1 hypothetical protein [Deltaproteobacteria bacterium]